MTTGKTQTVVSVNRSCYNYSHRNVETSTCCRFLEDGSTDYDETFRYYGGWLPGGEYRRCDDVIYYRYTPHFSPNFLPPIFFSKNIFPQFFLSQKNFFPNFYPPKFLSPNFFPPNFFPLNFFPQFFSGTFLSSLCSPLLKIAITLYALRMTLSYV